MDLRCDTVHLHIHGLPEGARWIRFRINGVPVGRARPAEGDAVHVPLLDLVRLATAAGMAPHLPRAVDVTAVVFDEQRQRLAEASLSACQLPPAPEVQRSAATAPWNGRLVAAALQHPGETQSWRLRVGDAIAALSSCPSDVAQVYMRVTLEPDLSAMPPGIVVVTWSCHYHRSTTDPPSAKRPRPLQPAAWGTQTVTAQLGGSAAGRDSVFLCPVPRSATDAEVHCTLQWQPLASPLAVMRYAVHGHVLPEVSVPASLLHATEDPAPSTGMMMGDAAAAPPATPNHALVPSPPPSSPPQKLAVIVGVSKYSRRPRGDLEWCDEDANTWYEYLTQRGYQCRILGDEFSPYSVYHGAATVVNVRRAVREMVAQAHGPNDHVVFVDSSHGNGDGRGNSWLCLLPDPYEAHTPDERSGTYWDRDLAADLSAGRTSQARTFVFLDACFSGGMLQELVESIPNSCGTSTCSEKGYGYDESQNQHGAWTEQFLVEGLQRQGALGGSLDLIALFQECYAKYVHTHTSRGDRPCLFANIGGQQYDTDRLQEPTQLPRGVLFARDVFGIP